MKATDALALQGINCHDEYSYYDWPIFSCLRRTNHSELSPSPGRIATGSSANQQELADRVAVEYNAATVLSGDSNIVGDGAPTA